MSQRFRTSPLPSLSIPGPLYSLHVLRVGFSRPGGPVPGSFRADGSVTLIRGGPLTVLVDTGGPWLRPHLPGLLQAQGVSPGDVTHVIVTHGHSDHAGNLNLFPSATLLVGFDLSRGEGLYLPHGLAQGAPLELHPGHLQVVPTPGHTRAHVSLVALGTSLGTVAVAGDTFERREDEEGEEGQRWWELSEDPREQRRSRDRLLATADVIVPGHGEPFTVTREWGHGDQEQEEDGHRDEEEEQKEEEEDDDDGDGHGDKAGEGESCLGGTGGRGDITEDMGAPLVMASRDMGTRLEKVGAVWVALGDVGTPLEVASRDIGDMARDMGTHQESWGHHWGHGDTLGDVGTSLEMTLRDMGTPLGTWGYTKGHGDTIGGGLKGHGDTSGDMGTMAMRRRVAMADVIVPGHGEPFSVTREWGQEEEEDGHRDKDEEEEQKEEEEDEDGREDKAGEGDESPAGTT